MAYINNHDIKTLKRRRDHLYKRMEYNGSSDTGYSFDAREAKTLDKVIQFLEMQAVRYVPDGEEAAVSD